MGDVALKRHTYCILGALRLGYHLLYGANGRLKNERER